MKTKVSFTMMPVLLLLLGSVGSLIYTISQSQDTSISSFKLFGEWTAYEYYDNNINPKGLKTELDYTKVNQIANLIRFESQENPCPGKLSKVEQEMEFFKIHFKSNGSVEILEKQYYKMNSFDSGCNNTIYDESYNQKLTSKWQLNHEEKTLSLFDSTKKHHTIFNILYFDESELHLSLKQEHDFIFVKLHKD